MTMNNCYCPNCSGSMTLDRNSVLVHHTGLIKGTLVCDKCNLRVEAESNLYWNPSSKLPKYHVVDVWTQDDLYCSMVENQEYAEIGEAMQKLHDNKSQDCGINYDVIRTTISLCNSFVEMELINLPPHNYDCPVCDKKMTVLYDAGADGKEICICYSCRTPYVVTQH